MATVYEDQIRLAQDETLYFLELQQLLRRSMWISIFMGITASTTLLAYVWATQKM